MEKTQTQVQVTLERHGLSNEQLRAIFRNMLLQRQLDNRGFQLNRQGKVPFALGSEGHEALQAGADAVLCASIFHYNRHTVAQAKDYLAAAGIPVRLD